LNDIVVVEEVGMSIVVLLDMTTVVVDSDTETSVDVDADVNVETTGIVLETGKTLMMGIIEKKVAVDIETVTRLKWLTVVVVVAAGTVTVWVKVPCTF
jgi:hypothetical protein